MKNFLMQIILHFLYRGIKVLNGKDTLITQELKRLPNYYKIKLETDLVDARKLCIEIVDGKVKKIKDENQKFDITIKFKDKDLAFKVLTGQKGIASAYSEHSFILYGNIYEAMGVTRILEQVEGYLFPKFINKKILKEPVEREISIFKTYLLCLFKFNN